MKRTITLSVFAILMIASFSINSNAQLSGTYSIPGDYATIAAAVTALNTVGVSGPVTFNVAAGHTETSVNITLTNTTPSAVNTVTFQKSGGGDNPKITAGVGISTTLDGIIRIAGTDYVTFDGIDLVDPPTNTTTTTKMEFGYALLKSSGTNGSQNITIKNCRIVLNTHSTIYTNTTGIYSANHTSASTSSLTVTSTAGANSNNSFFNNTIDSAYTCIWMGGYADAVAPYTYYDQNNDVGIGGGNILSKYGGSSSTAYGIYSLYQNNLEVENNTINGGSYGTRLHTSILYGIMSSTGTNSSVDISSNTVTLTDNVTTSSVYGISNGTGSSGTSNTVNINDNVITAFVKNGAVTSGSTYFLYQSASPYTLNIYNNNIHTHSLGPGTTLYSGGIYGIYSFGSNANAGSTTNIYSNTINNITRNQSALTTGTVYGIYTSSSGLTFNCYSNTVSNLTIPSTSSNYGIYLPNSSPTIANVYSNTVTNLNKTNASTGSLYGIYTSFSSTSSPVASVYNNSVNGLNVTGKGQVMGIGLAGSTTCAYTVYSNTIYNLDNTEQAIFGLYNSSGLTNNIYKNNLYDFYSTGDSGSTYGLCVGSSTAGATSNAYNNFVSDLRAPDATTYLSAGLYFFSSTANTVNAYYNTVYLNNSSAVATWFMGVYANTAPTLDMRNNVIVNVSTHSGGLTAAYQRSSTTLTTYASTSNRNDFYGGTPGPSNLIFYDGTNSDQTISDFKSRVSPRDGASFTELPPFINIGATPYNLRINAAVATQLETSGETISSPSITTDYDGEARYPNFGYPENPLYPPTAPDVGADEFGGIPLDITGPAISYTPLVNTQSTSNRSFTGVTITDGSGVNTTPGTKPRCYYKKSTNANSYTDNTSLTDGWKWVEANGSTSPFDFTIDYSLLFGGGGVSTGDIVQYFVVAQDLAGTPNVGINSGTFSGTPSSVADYANIFPLGGTINSYNISALFSGSYNVGTFQTYSSLTNAGGFFEAINGGIVNGNITVNITSDLTEDGTNSLNAITEDVPGSNYTVTIVPSSASEKVISGSVANSMIRINGADRVTIDGNNGLSDLSGTKYLRFRNTNGSFPTFEFLNDAKRNTLTNCYVESNNATPPAASVKAGTILLGTTTGTTGNDSISIIDCDVLDRTDVAGLPACGIFGDGSATYPNDNIIIDGCNIYNFYLDAAGGYNGGILIWGGATDWTVTDNSFYQTASRVYTTTATIRPIWNNNTLMNNMIVTGNYIGGSAPLCAGSPMTLSNAVSAITFYGMRLFVGGTTATSVQNNTIRNIDFTSTLTASGSIPFVPFIFPSTTSLVNVGNTSGNTVGSQSSTGDILITLNGASTYTSTSAGIYHYAYGTLQNNTVGGITVSGTTTGLTSFYAIYHTGSPASSFAISNNTVGSTTTANSIQSTTATQPFDFVGIRETAGGSVGISITNNTVRNISSISTGTSYMRGIYESGAGVTPTITGNTVQTLSSATTHSGGISSPSVVGIWDAATTTGQTISNNTISDLNATTTGVYSPHVHGLTYTSSSSTGTVSKNKIFDLENSATGTPYILGISAYYGTWTVSNNQITITNGEATDGINLSENVVNDFSAPLIFTQTDKSINTQNIPITYSTNQIQTPTSDVETFPVGQSYEEVPVEVQESKPESFTQTESVNGVIIGGIYDDCTVPQTYYYNSVYLGGTASSGTLNSYCYRKTSATHILRNNLFYNGRTNSGATGKHYCMYSTSSTLGSLNTNYNAYVNVDTTTMGLWGATDRSISTWRTSSGADNQSWSTLTSLVSQTNLFTSIGTGNLNIQSGNAEAWLVSGKGIAIGTVSEDYDGNARSTTVTGGCTDIGSDEFAGTPPSNPVMTENGTPGSGVTTTYYLYGRVLAQIDWGTEGGSYPSSMNVNYYSGVNPSNVIGGNYSNSYWTYTPVGSFSGPTYDITFFFGDNETGSIATPSTNTILSQYDGTWEVYPVGSGTFQSELTWNGVTSTYNVKVRDIKSFSDFALTDKDAPLPVVISEFSATVTGRDVNLLWITEQELNNSGFELQRARLSDKENRSEMRWEAVAFISGHGTTYDPQTYTYKDAKLNTGKYSYRLKQIDFNGNFEYFDMYNPREVAIGKPVAFDLSQNYPNPSNPKSKIDFAIPFNGKVSLKLYDLVGREVVVLINSNLESGYYTSEFDGSNLASGIYFYRIIAEGEGQKFSKTLKLVLVK